MEVVLSMRMVSLGFPGVVVVISPNGCARANTKRIKIRSLVTRIIFLNFFLSFISPKSYSTKFLKYRIRKIIMIGISQKSACGLKRLVIINYKSPLSLI